MNRGRISEALRALFRARKAARAAAREDAKWRETQRKKVIMAELAQTLQSGRRGGVNSD